jgi:hypothetical protein
MAGTHVRTRPTHQGGRVPISGPSMPPDPVTPPPGSWTRLGALVMPNLATTTPRSGATKKVTGVGRVGGGGPGVGPGCVGRGLVIGLSSRARFGLVWASRPCGFTWRGSLAESLHPALVSARPRLAWGRRAWPLMRGGSALRGLRWHAPRRRAPSCGSYGHDLAWSCGSGMARSWDGGQGRGPSSPGDGLPAVAALCAGSCGRDPSLGAVDPGRRLSHVPCGGAARPSAHSVAHYAACAYRRERSRWCSRVSKTS